MYQIIDDKNVRRLSDNACIPVDKDNKDYADYLVWVGKGNLPLPAPVPMVDLQAVVTQAVQERLDDYAQTRGYDNILSACTYANSSVPQFRKEGQYAVDMRDAHWAKCYEILNDVQHGRRPAPSSVTEVLMEMPAWHWPD